MHITLSLGRLVRPLTTTNRVARSIRFGEHRHIVDLERCDDGWSLPPGEAVVVFTNEWIGLPGDLTGLIFSRVSQYNNGIVVATTYVDPGWRGLIKLHVMNSSGRAYRLRLGAPIAHLAMFAINGEMLPETAKAPVGRHYKSTWSQILADERDPFPQTPARPRFRDAAIRNTNELLKTYSGYGLLALLGIGVLAGMRLYVELRQPLEVAPRMRALEETVARLDQARVVAGVESIEIPAGATSGEAAIDLPDDLAVTSDAYVASTLRRPAPRARTTAEMRFRSNQPQLEISVELPQPVNQPADVTVDWFVIP